MKGFLKLLFSRVGMVSLGILLQLIVLVASLLWFRDYAPVINVVSAVLSWGFVLYLIAGKSNPAYKLAWIILILGFPVLGVSLYLIFGGNRLSKRLRRKMEDIDRTLAESLQQEETVLEALRQTDPDAAIQSRYLSDQVHCPVWQNTETEYFDSGEAAFARMLEDLARARRTIYLEYFIVAEGELWDRFLTVLKAKAAAGVDVRLLYDDFGCIRRLPSNYAKQLESCGIRAKAFNRFVPLLDSRLNNRDHRKFLIIDGQIAYTGGINLADEYANLGQPRFGHWKDCAIRLQGDAVRSVTVMFLSMWNHFTGDKSLDLPPEPARSEAAAGWVQPYVDSPLDDEPVGRTVFLQLINRARRFVWIMTPYLIVDEGMAEALTNAAKSGVDVRIITPGIPDKPYVYELTRANYGPLLEGGVRIFEYSPGFVHSKLFLADDVSAAVGTVNLDFRSLYLHFEDGVLLSRAGCVPAVRADFDWTFPQCREVTLADARSVRLPRRIYRSILRLLSPLM
ncbi:MAG: cardiolipin synthase [Oscillospiraceae bacterium]|nr:cardiolipin synthase [Oscillospiraceae bacterium]